MEDRIDETHDYWRYSNRYIETAAPSPKAAHTAQRFVSKNDGPRFNVPYVLSQILGDAAINIRGQNMRKLFAKLFLLMLLSGCASMTEEYWAEKYESMTEQELADARANGATVTDIWIGAQTPSMLVCFDGECTVVQIY